MVVPPPKRDGAMGWKPKPSMAPNLKAIEKQQKDLKNASDWWQRSSDQKQKDLKNASDWSQSQWQWWSDQKQKDLNASDWWQWSSDQWSLSSWRSSDQWHQWPSWSQDSQGERYEKNMERNRHTDSDALQPAANDDDGFELVRVEEQEGDLDHAELIEQTKKVLKRHLHSHRFRSISPMPVHKAGKRGIHSRSPSPVAVFQRSGKQGKRRSRVRRRMRNSGGGKAWKRARARSASQHAKLDGKHEQLKVDVEHRLYSQLSIKEQFQCGRPVMQLVKDLWDGVVDVNAPFLRLTVFETIDEKTHEPMLRCIDNRRIYALKQFASLMDPDPVLVNINFFNLNTLHQVQRFIENSDQTNGRDVRVRKDKSKKRSQPLI